MTQLLESNVTDPELEAPSRSSSSVLSSQMLKCPENLAVVPSEERVFTLLHTLTPEK